MKGKLSTSKLLVENNIVPRVGLDFNLLKKAQGAIVNQRVGG
jgi:hypothetical protein